jgi:3-oxoacyl-[acyl-carrier-protein] synthase-1
VKVTKHIKLSFKNSSEITEFYRTLQIDYPKFFKMDGLSKLGFLASEMILKDSENRFIPREDVAIICFNSASSLDMDTQYQATIQNNHNYFPSPSLFVYTLPNIVAGEISIRNQFLGETFFYICRSFDTKQIIDIVKNTFCEKTTKAVLASWIEYYDEKKEVLMMWIENKTGALEFTVENLEKLSK